MTTEAGARRRWHLWLLGIVSAGVLGLAALAWYVSTDAFQAKVRSRVIAELEKITGGRVELGSLHAVPFQLRVEARDLTIHGLEAPGSVPFAHVDRLTAQIQIISVFGAELGFHSVDLEHPVIHLVTYPDGTTNQPLPVAARQRRDDHPVQDLFALSISRLSVHNGEVLWNDQKIPLDFVAHDVDASATYSILRNRYDGNLAIGQAGTTIQGYRPFSWALKSQFSLGENDIVLQSADFSAGSSRIHGSGRINDFRTMQLDAKYDASLDAREIAAILREPEVKSGSVHLTGNGKATPADFSTQGKMTLKDLAWKSPTSSIKDAALASDFSMNKNELKLTDIKGRVLGGVVSGDANVVNWLAPWATTRPPKASLQKGSVQLRVKDVSIGELESLLSARGYSLERLNLAGVANGSVAARWIGSPLDSEVEVASDIVPPPRISPMQLPLTAHVRGLYKVKAAELQLSELALNTRASQLRGSGDLSSISNLNFSAATTDLSEWYPLLTLLKIHTPLPVALHGKAAFQGTATERLDSPLLAGTLSVQDFDVLIRANHGATTTIHWDGLDTGIRISANKISASHGHLHHDDTSIDFDTSLGMNDWEFTDSSPIHAQINMQNASAEEIVALMGKSYPVTGVFSLSAQLSGTVQSLDGHGHLQLPSGTIYGEPVKDVETAFVLSGDHIQFENLSAGYRDAALTGSGSYSWNSHAIRADLTGRNFSLATIRELQASQVELEGASDFHLNVDGTTDHPSVRGNVALKALLLNGEPIGNFNLEATTQGSDMVVSGRSDSERAAVALSGTIQLSGDYPANLNVNFNQFNVHPLLTPYMAGHVSGLTPLSGQGNIRGELRHPEDITVSASVNDFHVDVENVQLHSDGIVHMAIAERTLKLDPFRLIGEGTDLSGDGSIQLNGEHTLDFRAQGKVNLKLLESYNSDFTSSGDAEMNVAVSGSPANPVVLGKLQVTSGSVAYIALPSALSDINGTIVFTRNRAEIETLTARTGGGSLTFRGFATTYNRQFNFDLGVTGQDVRLRYPPGVSATSSMDIKFAGTSTASLLSGDISVNKLGMTPGFDFGAYLERSAQTSSLPQNNPLLNRIRLDVHVVTAPELQMQTAVVRLSGDADLRLRGTASKPVLLGRADVIEGEAYFNGTKYRLERGDVTFTSPVTTTPILDLQASTRIRDYDVTLNLNGDVDKLNITYRSEPPLPTADIIALLAFGQTTEESAQLQQSNQSAFSTAASSALINEALNATVSNRVQRLFGVSRIKIDPQGLSTETSTTQTGPAVTIEQQVKNNLTITYTTLVSQASQQIIQVEYNLTRNVSIVGLRDQNGVTSFVAKIRRRRQ